LAGRWVVVSIHDVAPALTDEVRWLLDVLDAMEARPRVLKVIPRSADDARLRDAPRLVRLLRDERLAGSEIVLHGYTHRASGALRGAWPTRLRGRLFAGAAAEFLTLDRREMRRRLEAGREDLRDLGAEPRGFCAPGWLAPAAIRPILRHLDFRYYVGMNTLHDLRTGRSRWMPWVGYMGADPWQERLVRLAGAAQLTAAPFSPVVKVFLHPQHASRSDDLRRTLRVLGQLVRHRKPTTYGQLLDC